MLSKTENDCLVHLKIACFCKYGKACEKRVVVNFCIGIMITSTTAAAPQINGIIAQFQRNKKQITVQVRVSGKSCQLTWHSYIACAEPYLGWEVLIARLYKALAKLPCAYVHMHFWLIKISLCFCASRRECQSVARLSCWWQIALTHSLAGAT